jgi:hypothetical protein
MNDLHLALRLVFSSASASSSSWIGATALSIPSYFSLTSCSEIFFFNTFKSFFISSFHSLSWTFQTRESFYRNRLSAWRPAVATLEDQRFSVRVNSLSHMFRFFLGQGALEPCLLSALLCCPQKNVPGARLWLGGAIFPLPPVPSWYFLTMHESFVSVRYHTFCVCVILPSIWQSNEKKKQNSTVRVLCDGKSEDWCN